MNFPVVSFVLLFVLPMSAILASLPPASLRQVALELGVAVLLAVAAMLLPRLLRRLLLRRRRVPTARALARLDWPDSLSRNEMEAFCIAWLRSQGWTVTLTTDPGQAAESVYLVARRAGAALTVLCDPSGEDLNPAGIRAFAHAAAQSGGTQSDGARAILLTLVRRPLPAPAEAAARQAGVALLRVADLPQLDTLAPAAPRAAEAPAPAPVAA